MTDDGAGESDERQEHGDDEVDFDTWNRNWQCRWCSCCDDRTCAFRECLRFGTCPCTWP